MRWLIPLLLILAHPVYAADLLLSTRPNAPRPGELVTVTATIPGNVSDTLFSWIVDGVEILSGYGQREAQVIMPELGNTTSVQVLIDGEELRDPLVLRPQRVTIEWEGTSNTPPLYLGRPLFSAQGAVRAYAIAELITPRGARVLPADIKYTWSVDGVPRRESGYGRDSITVEPPLFNRPFTLSVRAETRSGLSAEDSVAITATQSSVAIYEVSPLRGLINRAVIGATSLQATEVTFVAYALNGPADLSYEWSLNGSPVAISGTDPRVVTFRKTGEGIGQYRIGVRAQNGRPFGTFQQSFLLNF